MTIDSISTDCGDVWSLSQWLESEDARILQKQLEEKIINMLFSHDPTSPAFQRIATQLAWIGSRPERKPFLEKEIIALSLADDDSIQTCGFLKK